MRISRLTLIILLCGIGGVAGAQSLWSPGFTGYLSGKSSLQLGDLISVTIDTNTKLSYTSSNVSDRTLTLEFSGGTSGNPLSFLPKGTAGEKSTIKGGEAVTLSTTLVGRVQKIDPTGHAYVEGTRTLQINGRQEMITVSGWLAPAMLTGGRTIDFSELADSKLVFSSTLTQGQPLLTQADITQLLSQASGTTTSSQSTGAATGPAPAPAAPQTGSAASPGVQLSDAKKRQLIIEYLNKMLDLIFQKGGA